MRLRVRPSGDDASGRRATSAKASKRARQSPPASPAAPPIEFVEASTPTTTAHRTGTMKGVGKRDSSASLSARITRALSLPRHKARKTAPVQPPRLTLDNPCDFGPSPSETLTHNAISDDYVHIVCLGDSHQLVSVNEDSVGTRVGPSTSPIERHAPGDKTHFSDVAPPRPVVGGSKPSMKRVATSDSLTSTEARSTASRSWLRRASRLLDSHQEDPPKAIAVQSDVTHTRHARHMSLGGLLVDKVISAPSRNSRRSMGSLPGLTMPTPTPQPNAKRQSVVMNPIPLALLAPPSPPPSLLGPSTPEKATFEPLPESLSERRFTVRRKPVPTFIDNRVVSPPPASLGWTTLSKTESPPSISGQSTDPTVEHPDETFSGEMGHLFDEMMDEASSFNSSQTHSVSHARGASSVGSPGSNSGLTLGSNTSASLSSWTLASRSSSTTVTNPTTVWSNSSKVRQQLCGRERGSASHGPVKTTVLRRAVAPSYTVSPTVGSGNIIVAQPPVYSIPTGMPLSPARASPAPSSGRTASPALSTHSQFSVNPARRSLESLTLAMSPPSAFSSIQRRSSQRHHMPKDKDVGVASWR